MENNNRKNNISINDSLIVEIAQKVLSVESLAVQELIGRIGTEFIKAVDTLYDCKGRVIVTGIGKSGIIAKKIAATLASTGTPAIFLHPVEAVHGDLGIVLKNDIVICISKSGTTDEITRLFPVFIQLGVKTIAMTGNLRSALADRCDIVLDVSVKEEACTNNLAPTASTTATLAMGDALAVALLEKRQFNSKDFAFLHPAGSLGKKLTQIDEIMFSGDKVPRVSLNASLQDVIVEITRKRFGSTCVLDENGMLAGIITDGDIRRLFQTRKEFSNIIAGDIMNATPKIIYAGSFASQAMQLMQEFNINQIIVVDTEHFPKGIIHIHDLLEAGITV